MPQICHKFGKRINFISKLTFKCRKYAANFRKVMFLMKFQKQNAANLQIYTLNLKNKKQKILLIQMGTALHFMTAELF